MKKNMFKITRNFMMFILCISLFMVNISATENTLSDELNSIVFQNEDEIEYCSYEDYLKNKEEFNQMIQEINQIANDSIHNTTDHIDAFDEGFQLEEKVKSLGYYKFSDSQKSVYAALVEASENNGASLMGTGIDDGNIYYPDIPGMDMYVTYFTYNHNGVTEYMADVMVVLNPEDRKSSLVRIFDAAELFDNITFGDLAEKTIKCTASGIVSSLLPTSGSFAIDLVMSLTEPFIPQSHYTNDATLTLKVSSISTVSHIWKKTGNKFYFRLATNAATIKESWIFVDTTGSHYYAYNEYYVESPNYRSASVAASQTTNTSFSIPDIKYQTKGFLGIYFTKLTVSPYYAGLPASLAFD